MNYKNQDTIATTTTTTQTKKCSDCKKTLPLTNFGKNKSSKDGLTNICLECKRKRNSKTNKKNNKKKRIQGMKSNLKRYDFIEQNKSYPSWKCIIEEYLKPNPEITDYSLLPLVVESPMGTNKTQVLIDCIEQNPDKSIVYLTVNLSTIESTSKKLEKLNIPHIKHTNPQLELQDFLEPKERKVILITPDSYYKIQDPDILIKDEINSILVEMTSKLNTKAVYARDDKHSEKIKFQFLETYNRIKNHPRYISLDAQVPYWVYTHQPRTKVKNLYRKTKDINIFTSKENRYLYLKFKKKILESNLNQRIVIQSNTKNFLKDIKEELETRGFKCLLITAESNENITEEEVKEYQEKGFIILSSPKISRGFSFFADEVFIYDSGRAVHPYVIFQMIDRARDSKVINVALEENKEHIETDTFLMNKCKALNDYNDTLFKFEVNQRQLQEDRVNYIIHLLELNYKHKKTESKEDILDSIIRNYIYSNQTPDIEQLKSRGYQEETIKRLFQKNLMIIKPDLFIDFYSK